MKIVGVIPARYESSRFPGKPLANIFGKPMVWWVFHRAKRVKKLDEVYVATDDMRIQDVCEEEGIPVVMTSKIHTNGSERLSEFAGKVEADIYVTIQGDEPLLEPDVIEKVLETLEIDGDIMCATLKTAYHNPVDVINGTTPKIVTDLNDNALLFTRSPIPYPKAALDFVIYKPIGVYAWRKSLIVEYRNLQIGPIERAEEIELLRLLENGYKVKVGIVESETIAVDTYKDLERVIQFLEKHPEERIVD